jgi:hypothetical protein
VFHSVHAQTQTVQHSVVERLEQSSVSVGAVSRVIAERYHSSLLSFHWYIHSRPAPTGEAESLRRRKGKRANDAMRGRAFFAPNGVTVLPTGSATAML